MPEPRALASAVATCCAGNTNPLSAATICGLGLTFALVASPVSAATFTVTNTDDAGPGSLRQAVIDANANPGPDDIIFSSVSGTITLTSGQIDVTDSVNIHGPGAEVLTLDGNNTSRVFSNYLYRAELDFSISDLTLTNAGDGAPAIETEVFFSSISLTINDCVISGNAGRAIVAGGYQSSITLTIQDSVVSGNAGGAIGAGGYGGYAEVAVRDSTISDNQSGIGSGEGKLTVQNTVISGNRGVGVSLYGGYLNVYNTVISGNGAGMYAGFNLQSNAAVSIQNSEILDNNGVGIYMGGFSHILSMDDSTIQGNAGDGMFGFSVDLVVRNTTISGNASGISAINGRRDSAEIAYSAIYGNEGIGVYITDTVVVSNSTISGNLGGGMDVHGGTIANSTITENSAEQGGGIRKLGGSGTYEEITIVNSVVAGNTATASDPDLSGEFNVLYSLIQDPGSAVINETVPSPNIFGEDPLLGPLQDNGGPTPTHALLADSPAIDAGDPAFVPPPDFDQRGVGFDRAVGRIDMGAFEVQNPGDGGEIGDFVWADVNGDGIQDADEPGQPGVRIALEDCADNVLSRTTTDADGGYRFTGVPVGRNRIRFDAPSGFVFSPPFADGQGGKDSNADPATGLSNCFPMPVGKVREGIDAGLVRQPGGTARLGDFVWRDLNEDGIQGPDEPGIGGVKVQLLDCRHNTLDETVTGASGDYLFEGLEAGRYQIGFDAPLNFVFSPAEQGDRRGMDSNPDPATGITKCLTLNDGQTRPGIDAGLIGKPPGTGEIGDLVWHDLNGDGIQDVDEPGLANVQVKLRSCGGDVLARATTDGAGGYRFADLPVANYKVEFITPDGFTLSPMEQGDKRAKDSNPFPETGLTVCLPIEEGQVRQGIDAGMNEE